MNVSPAAEATCRIGYDANSDLWTDECTVTAATSTAVVTGYIDMGVCDVEDSMCSYASFHGPGVSEGWQAGIVSQVFVVQPGEDYVLSSTCCANLVLSLIHI